MNSESATLTILLDVLSPRQGEDHIVTSFRKDAVRSVWSTGKDLQSCHSRCALPLAETGRRFLFSVTFLLLPTPDVHSFY